MKKTIIFNLLFVVFVCSFGIAQEAWQTHTRGLLHQSVFNTGALGVQYNSFRTAWTGDSLRTPFEWPGNSYFRYNNHDNWYYNSCGGGLAMLCDTGSWNNRGDYVIYDSIVAASGNLMIGCLGLGTSGIYRDGTGLFYWPGTVTKMTNFPLNSDGTWNASYDPTEAEEIITSSVKTPYGITITRVSRVWSYPGYDGFIIYDYKFENTGDRYKGIAGNIPDTLSDIAVSWVESLFPSYVYENPLGDYTQAASKQLSRFDLKRYMQYVHSPDGRPEPTNYAAWSAKGTYGGGLTAPAAVGYMLLYFDYDHLMKISDTRFANVIGTTNNDVAYVTDPGGKFKQPWNVASTQANLSCTKILAHVQGSTSRYNIWNPEVPSRNDNILKSVLVPADSAYWFGRGRPNNNYNFASPMVHSYALGPYKLAPHESFHVVMAEVAGFGPGRASDSQFKDYGGGNETTSGNLTDNNIHPVASWDSVITYTNAPTSISSTGGIGINYIPTYGIPAYIRDTNVVSIRDVADRCIQLYSGNTSVIKYDTSQYEPWGWTGATSYVPPPGNAAMNTYAPSPSAIAARSHGWNAGIKIPLPAPIFAVRDSAVYSGSYNAGQFSWLATIDSIPALIRSYIKSGLNYYQILRSTSQLGPWTILDSVGRKDSRYYNTTLGTYIFIDSTGQIGKTYYYAVVSVDSLCRKSGLTNVQQYHSSYISGIQNGNTNQPYKYGLNQNYPNPFNPSTQITYTIAKRGTVTLVVYDLLGREVSRLVNEVKEAGSYTATLNGARLSSGVYFYKLSSGSFVQTKKMLLMK